MGECSGCKHWIIQRKTLYDSSEIINYQSEPGKGQCEQLKIDTPSEFGCNKFEAGDEHYEILAKKPGEPWHHSHWDKCPDCGGRGSSIEKGTCYRCCGTGRVLYYDDGYIGEEHTRRHPNENQRGMTPPQPKCPSCDKEVNREWVACPYCGKRIIEPPQRMTQVDSLSTGAI